MIATGLDIVVADDGIAAARTGSLVATGAVAVAVVVSCAGWATGTVDAAVVAVVV